MDAINPEDVLRLFPRYRYNDFSPDILKDPLYTVILSEETTKDTSTVPLEKLQDHIVDYIAEVERGYFVPTFEKFETIKSGTFLIKCADERSQTWLKKVSETMTVPGYAKLKTASVGDIFVKPFDRLYLAYVIIMSEQGDLNMQCLELLNKRVDFSNWKILDKGRFFVNGIQKFQVYLEIPGSALVSLKENHFMLKYGLERIEVMIVNFPDVTKLSLDK